VFIREKCDSCAECLIQCPFTDYDGERAAAEWEQLMAGRTAPILSECATCAACNEICPQGANPFDLIVELQEQTGALNVSDKMKEMFSAMCQAKNKVTPGDPERPALSVCVVRRSFPHDVKGRPFEGLTLIRGEDYFCQMGWVHLGMFSPVREGLAAFIQNLAALGHDEIIFVHDECYSAATVVARDLGVEVPFRPIHVLEYLRDWLKEHTREVKPLGMKIAYQRPCSSRWTPEKEPLVDEVLSLIGAERVKREYDRKNALCCAFPLMVTDPQRAISYKNKNIEDAKTHGAEALATLCPLCYQSLAPVVSEHGLPAYTMIDLVRMALGEQLD
jgi:Fe-S oxidoreductase